MFVAICIEIVETSVNKDSVTITFQGTGPFSCQLDDQPSVPCTSPVRYDGLFIGARTATITGAANTCTEIAHFDITCEWVLWLCTYRIIAYIFCISLPLELFPPKQ